MLIEFTVRNYRSFKEPVTLSLIATALKSAHPDVDRDNVFSVTDKMNLLRSSVIYGANASGKSNLIRALAFMRRFVLDSSRETQADEAIPVESFRLSTETENAPSYFEVVFCLANKRYRYGFEADAQRIHSEWLYHVPTEREALLFQRQGNSISLSGQFKEGKGLESRTRENALFLSVAAQFNGPIATEILRWFRSVGVILGVEDVGYRGFTISKFEDGSFQDEIKTIIKRLDFGIADIEIQSQEVPEGDFPIGLFRELQKVIDPDEKQDFRPPTQVKRVASTHKKYTASNTFDSFVTFDFENNESAGTKKLFYLLGPILDILKSGRVLFIDELDARFHPFIVLAILRLFNSPLSNPLNAQLVFATHSTNLLDNKLLRRDQIWLLEKDRFGATDLFSLAEYRVRNDASFEKDYLAGKYGAVPYVSSLDPIFENNNG